MPPIEPTVADEGFACRNCGDVDAPAVTGRCPNCDAPLVLSTDGVGSPSSADDAEFADQRRFVDVHPFAPDAIVSLGEGATPLISCPSLADDLGVDRVLLKDEGRNPTGSAVDRGLSLSITDAVSRGRERVALPTTGHGGQSAAAYAGRAGLDVTAFVPTRSSHLTKAMVNVHGGEMTVVEGRFSDAVAAFEDWLAERRQDVEAGSGKGGGEDVEEGNGEGGGAPLRESIAGVGPASPFRRTGAKLLAHELLAQLAEPPAAIVYPTGHGIGLAGAGAAFAERRDAELIETVPKLVAAQPAGCAPIVRALAEEGGFGAWDGPDTIAGSLESPDPARGREAVEAVRETGGEGITVPDDELLAAAVDATAATGVELGTAGGVGVAGARQLAEGFDADDTVVIVNPVHGSKESDVLRSELMSRGR